MINEITKEDLKEMGLPIKKRQWAKSSDKKEVFKRDKEMKENFNCKHIHQAVEPIIDHRGDNIDDYRICLDCNKIIL